MSPVQLTKRLMLKERAEMFKASRTFFAKRGVMEVDCPALLSRPSIDAHIDPIACLPYDSRRWLHTSPEYCMKRLIAEGSGDIYQMSHVYRDGEVGRRHNPEFTMTEWYRIGMSYEAMIDETLDYIRLFVGDLPKQLISYREAFKTYAGIDYLTASTEELAKLADANADARDTLLNFIMGSKIEPHLGRGCLTVLRDYPANQAALAKTTIRDGEPIAERFEVYLSGVELANGYHELTCATEQEKRLNESNQERIHLGKEPLPIDAPFLEALAHLPDCAGVAVGFDRLLMLRLQATDIASIIPFNWKTS